MLKIGVVGAGHLGKIHINILKDVDFVELIGFFDIDKNVSSNIENETKTKAFNSLNELIEKCDVLDIVTPTINHFETAQTALKKSKHVFIEKPVTHTLNEVRELIKLSEEAAVKAQVGHVERFNPAFSNAKQHINKPKFIETHRLTTFNPRGTDVSVVLDLMIHDLDILLNVVQQPIQNIHASGVSIISESADIANARIEFMDGCVANITASRMSLKSMRKSRFFQNNAYISIDFLKKKYEFISMEDAEEQNSFLPIIDLGIKGKKQIKIQTESPTAINAIEEELKSFIHCIKNDLEPEVSLHSAQQCLKLALDIEEKISKTI
jgi:predicted dehydrogenase